MVRGRKPKPTATKEANGAYRKNPQRRNKAEPSPPSGEPQMPAWIAEDDIAKSCWDYTVRIVREMRLLSEADAHPIAGYCSDFAQWFRLRAIVSGGDVARMTGEGDKVRVEAVQVHKYQDRMAKFWAEYGMTPSARSRLIANQAEDTEDPYSELIARMGNG